MFFSMFFFLDYVTLLHYSVSFWIIFWQLYFLKYSPHSHSLCSCHCMRHILFLKYFWICLKFLRLLLHQFFYFTFFFRSHYFGTLFLSICFILQRFYFFSFFRQCVIKLCFFFPLPMISTHTSTHTFKTHSLCFIKNEEKKDK